MPLLTGLLCVRRQPPYTANEPLDCVIPPRGCDVFASVYDLACLLDNAPDSNHGYHISGNAIMIATATLRQHLRCHPSLQVLAGSLLDFRPTFKDDYAGSEKAGTLTRLMGLSEPCHLSVRDIMDLMFRNYHRVLLPYNVGQDYLVFELALQSPRGCYIKVWDSKKVWAKGDPKKRDETVTLLEVFFGGDRKVAVRTWEEGDPTYEAGYGAAAFAFMIMCYRALGEQPRNWRGVDEALFRNHMWACILSGIIVELPKARVF